MKIAEDIWIAGAYFAEIDQLGQLRIVGPNNHLYLGSLVAKGMTITEAELDQGQMRLSGVMEAGAAQWPDPAMGPIRRVRGFIELEGRHPSFKEVRSSHPHELLPEEAQVVSENPLTIRYVRHWWKHWYGTQIRFECAGNYDRPLKQAQLQAEGPVRFELITICDEVPQPALVGAVSPPQSEIPADEAFYESLSQRSAAEINHLVAFNKTSGFEYGTVFPRDWMEAADLGGELLSLSARQHMYSKALEFVAEDGSGWHENIVGEQLFESSEQYQQMRGSFAELVGKSTERVLEGLKHWIDENQPDLVTRHMIDIEPHYLLGLRHLDWNSLEAADQERLRRVARWVIRTAKRQPLITFKKIPPIEKRHAEERYYGVGNWRDSGRAFKLVHPIIAPYDVNAVFYPQALREIADHARDLEMTPEEIEPLIRKWERVKERYRFKNPDGSTAFALALYDVHVQNNQLRYRQLTVNHLDESYDYFYGDPSEEEAISFCQRLLDPEYFYTPSGAMLVGAQEDFYTTLHYHGKVIWTKQTAYTVAGLRRTLQRHPEWKPATLELISRAARLTAASSLKAFAELDGAPELHYDLEGQAHFYNDQPKAEGPMNKVQLWSAVGALRIMTDYQALLAQEKAR